MATFTADNAASYLASLYGDRGNVYCVTGTYSLTTAMSTNDVINITKIPGGAQPLPSWISHTQGKWKLGWSGSATLWGTTTAISTSTFVAPSSTSAQGSLGDDISVQAVCSSAPTASGTLTAFIFYKLVDID